MILFNPLLFQQSKKHRECSRDFLNDFEGKDQDHLLECMRVLNGVL